MYNKILQNKWFTTLKIAEGTKSSCSWNYILKKLNPNRNGKIFNNIKDQYLSAILLSLVNGEYKRYAENKANNKSLRPKDCAKSLYSFHTYRYKLSDEDENGNVITHNASFIHNIGFQGFDFDPEKSNYDANQRLIIGETLKQILYEKLSDKKWFICSTLSTGGNGAHCWTWSKPNEYIEDDEKVRWYYTNYDMKLWYMCECLIELKKRIDWIDLNKIKIDDGMRRPGQTLNVTVVDTNPFINFNFEYDYDYDVVDKFSSYDGTTYRTEQNIPFITEDEKLTYELYKTYVEIQQNVKTKFDDKDKNYNDKLNIISNEFDLSKCKPYYWRHNKNANLGWTGNQVIHTLLWFFDKETVKKIWEHPNFYTQNPRDWIRFVDSWDFDDSHMPNFKLIQFLNNECGFNLKYEHIIKTKELEEQYDHVIRLKENEFIGDYKDELFNNCIKTGINLLISGVGTGKTTLWINRDKELKQDILNIGMMKSTIITEPYNAILETKFGEGGYKITKYKGNLHLSWNTIEKGLCAANYKKLVELSNKDNQDWNQIDYIVCDESHLLTKEAFRSNDLIKVITFLRRAAEHIPVILMTGTPCDEYDLFDNINTIYIDKKDNRKITYRNLRFQPDETLKRWDIMAISTLVEQLVKDGRKVYVYDGDGSLRGFKRLIRTLPNNIRCCIYHKRHIDDVIDSDDMKYINKHHVLGDQYDVLCSSCYFGVGNDLNDECDTACIIIGNHVWQEDVQIVGRWRNSKDIKVYNIINKDNEYRTSKLDKKLLIKEKQKWITNGYHDSINRHFNIAIGSQNIDIHNESEIPIFTLMCVNNDYNMPLDYKYEMLTKNYFIVDDEQISPLRWCVDDIENGKLIIELMKKEGKSDKTKFIIDLLSNNQNILWHNEDARLLRWQKCAKFIFNICRELFDTLYIDTNYGMAYSHLQSIELFKKIYYLFKGESFIDTHLDWAEIYAYDWYRKQLKGKDLKRLNEDFIEQHGISYEEHIGIVAYILMANWDNKSSQADHVVINDYYNKFNWNCKLYLNMHDEMINTLEKLVKYELNDDSIFDNNMFELVKYMDKESLITEIHDKHRVSLVKMEIYKKLYNKIRYRRKLINQENAKGGKKVVIKKDMPKYGLKIGDTFDTQKELAHKIGKTEKTICQWRNKGWIE